MGLELWCLTPLSTIYNNEVRVIVFNATFYNISQWGFGLWSLVPLSKIYHNEVRVMVFNATFYNISQ